MGIFIQIVRNVVLMILAIYRYAISPWLKPSCRFYPTCSDYAQTAIEQYGALYGSWLAFKRILRCHPLHAGGFDPVPERETTS